MIAFNRVLIDGFILSVIFTAYVFGTLKWNYRLWIQDFPADIRAMVPPKSDREKRMTVYMAIPLFLIILAGPLVSLLLVKSASGADLTFLRAWLHAYLVWEFVNLWDWLIIDWGYLLFVNPAKPPIPGTEGARGYRDYAFHFYGFLKGSVGGIVLALPPAAISMLV